MNMNKILVAIVTFVFLLSSVGMVTAQTPTYAIPTADQCKTPNKTLFITGGPGDLYNVTTLNAPTSTCVKITFHNADTVDHTFTINAISSDNVTYFNIYSKSGQTNSSNFWTPSKSMSLNFICIVPGHEAAGMVGTLKVGSSSSAPGFEFIPLVLGLFVATGLVTTYRKRKN